MPHKTIVYILRHAQPAQVDIPNRERPLAPTGCKQAEALVPYLCDLDLAAVYTSPFERAVRTVMPFCNAAGIAPILREELRESAADEELPRVRDRMLREIGSIVGKHDGGHLLVCTHGGNLWGFITHFDDTFAYADYRRIRCPDLMRFVFNGSEDRWDVQFDFDL